MDGAASGEPPPHAHAPLGAGRGVDLPVGALEAADDDGRARPPEDEDRRPRLGAHDRLVEGERLGRLAEPGRDDPHRARQRTRTPARASLTAAEAGADASSVTSSGSPARAASSARRSSAGSPSRSSSARASASAPGGRRSRLGGLVGCLGRQSRRAPAPRAGPPRAGRRRRPAGSRRRTATPRRASAIAWRSRSISSRWRRVARRADSTRRRAASTSSAHGPGSAPAASATCSSSTARCQAVTSGPWSTHSRSSSRAIGSSAAPARVHRLAHARSRRDHAPGRGPPPRRASRPGAGGARDSRPRPPARAGARAQPASSGSGRSRSRGHATGRRSKSAPRRGPSATPAASRKQYPPGMPLGGLPMLRMPGRVVAGPRPRPNPRPDQLQVARHEERAGVDQRPAAAQREPKQEEVHDRAERIRARREQDAPERPTRRTPRA